MFTKPLVKPKKCRPGGFPGRHSFYYLLAAIANALSNTFFPFIIP